MKCCLRFVDHRCTADDPQLFLPHLPLLPLLLSLVVGTQIQSSSSSYYYTNSTSTPISDLNIITLSIPNPNPNRFKHHPSSMEHQHQGAQTTNRNHHHHHPYNGGGGGGREDCWTEGATATLIDAWGDRYLALSRGNLRQKDWKDVADAVNGRSDGVKPRRTDIQCKNRIDTIKKKYKLEKSKPGPSQWPFYSRLDHLIGTTTPPARKTTTPRPPPPPPSPPLPLSLPSYVHKPPAVTFTVKQGKGKMYNHNPNPPNLNAGGVYSGGSSSKSRLNSPDSTESSGGGAGGGGDEDDDDDDDVDDDDDDDDAVFNNGSARKHQMGRDSSDGTPFRELAKAVLKFGEIYERIESSKQQQMMELERQKMEFTKDLEFQRMQMFMEAQLELEKMKRPKNSSTTGKKL